VNTIKLYIIPNINGKKEKPMKKLSLLFVMIFALGAMFAAITDYYTFTALTGTYTEITGTTVPGIAGDDVISAPIEIGFTFPYGTSTFTQVKACSNGFIALGTTVTSTTWTNDVASTAVCPALMPYYEDMTLSTAGIVSYLTQGAAPNRTFTVQYDDVPYLGGTSSVNFQAILYENGKVELVYGAQSAAYAASASIGINMLPGGVNNFWSVTPGAPATASSTVANNAVAAWPGSGTIYQFNPPVAVPNDLGASAITGNLTPSVGTSWPYVVSIRNWGTANQTTYQVKLMSGTTELASVAGPTIAAGMTADVTLNWTPAATGPMSIFGKVVLAGDQNANNDATQPINVVVQAAGTVAVTIGAGDQLAPMPIDFYWMNSLYECIYLPGEINLGGLITGLAFYNSFFTNLPGMPTNIWLGETALTDLSAGWIPSTQLTAVFSGTVDYPAGANTVTIALTTPYAYGGGSLVMMMERPMDTQYYDYTDNFQCQTVGTARSRLLYSDTIDFDPTNPAAATPTGQFPKTTLYFVVGGMGALQGTVTSGGNPLAGATVAVAGTALSFVTGADGTYSFPYVTQGAHQVTCNKIGYNPQTQNVTIVENQTSTVNFNMVQLPVVNVTGTVVGSDQPTVGLANATVSLTGMVDYTATTNAQGQYTITGVYSSQSYGYNVTVAGYQPATGTINVGTTNYTLNVTCNEISIPATGVQAVEAAPVVNITWEAPGTGGGEWIRWDTGLNNDSIGTGAAADFDVASRWPVANLGDYQGMNLYAIEFWPAELGTTYSARVWTGGDATAPGTMVCDQAIPSITEDTFNTVILDTPVPIAAGQELWFGIRCNATGGYPAGCDAGPQHEGLGNMIFFSGAWATLSSLNPALTFDWNLAAYVGYSAPTSRPMALQPIPFNYDRITNGTLAASGKGNKAVTLSTNRTENTRVLTGYKVWRLLQGQETNETAWTLLTANTITATAYTDASWASVADGTYKWAVKAVYTNDVVSVPAFSNPLQKLTQIGTVSGIVREPNNAPIVGATISCLTYTATSNSTGAYSLQVPAGTHTVTCSKPGYVTGTQTGVVVVTGQTTIVNFVLQPSGVVMDESFEGATFPPNGWTQVITDTGAAVNGVLPTWCRVGEIAIVPAITPPDGVWQAAMWWSYSHQEEWLITPEFLCPPLDPELRFQGYIFLGSPNSDHYYVKVSTDGGTNWTILWDAVAVGGGAYSDYTVPFVISLDAYAGQMIMLAWHADDPPTNDGMWNVAAIDNVEVEGGTASDDPVTPVVATALNGNYPNPFNPETTISYSVKNSAPVAIEIYNTKGQKVRTLVNETKASGNYSVRWDGTDENGQKVTSGVYFYKMNTGKYTSSKKMILMK
jgi:hypothetical protein